MTIVPGSMLPRVSISSDIRIDGGKRRRPRPLIRETSLADYESIAELHARNDLAIGSKQAWQSLWTGNPEYMRRPDWPLGWVIETPAGEIVGSVSSIPIPHHLHGREVIVSTVCSWVVDADYRSYSMTIVDKLLKQGSADLFLSTTVSRATEPCFGVFEFSRVPVGVWDRVDFWITDYWSFLDVAGKAGLISLPWCIRPAVTATLYCRDLIRIRRRSKNLQMESCARFDDRFEVFWEELKRMNPHTLLADRSRTFLEWHFRGADLGRDVQVLAASCGDRLTAYAIFDRQDNVSIGLKRMRLVDFQALDGHHHFLFAALDAMLEHCRREHIHLLEITGKCFNRTGKRGISPPYSRTLSSWVYYYRSGRMSNSETFSNAGIWAPTAFDGDMSLHDVRRLP